MKVFIILAGFIVYGSSSTTRLFPRDNSHYVEGESRYIWMPDGDGVPHLVNLEEPFDDTFLNCRAIDSNQYWLFTRHNPTSPEIIVNGNKSSILNSNYHAFRPTKVIVHGWFSNGNSKVNTMITEAFLEVQDVNVIVMDWRGLAYANYFTASKGVAEVGQSLGNFLIWIFNTVGGNWNQLHLVGFSLGAHVVSNAGRTASGKPIRVTGLDPAGPRWGGNSLALNRHAGQYVEAIHTDGGRLGIFDQIGDADFYPNGGRNRQPGCWLSTCSHSRSYELFASSVRTNHFIGKLCDNIDQAQNNQCSGASMHMGNNLLNKHGHGIYGLKTDSSWPF